MGGVSAFGIPLSNFEQDKREDSGVRNASAQRVTRHSALGTKHCLT